MSERIDNVSRRAFLKGVLGAGGLVLGVRLLGADVLAQDEGEGSEEERPAHDPDIWLAIAESGAVTVVAHRSEMGTGIRTSLPMVVADELGAEWDRVTIEQADGDPRYGSQNTDGSRSIRRFYEVMRRAGAAARTMLERAAAERWGVEPSDCSAGGHEVRGPGGLRLGFGALAADAAELPVPAAADLELKPRSELRYVGKGVPPADLEAIVRGEASFGADVRRPGMKFAAVARSPSLGGRPESVDAEAAEEVPGVTDVVTLEPFSAPHAFQALGGVAVVADSTWAALEGRKRLEITWEPGPHAGYDSESYGRALLETARQPGRVVRERGDVDAGLEEAAQVVTADYETPMLAHASMETPVATAEVTRAGCEAWAPTQNPQAARQQLAADLELDPEQVTVHVTLLGGGFGRKSKPDFIVEAAKLSRAVGAPVQVFWTREDDIRHDYYHAPAALHLEAGLDGEGRATSWLQRSVFPTISSTFQDGANQGSAMELHLGFTDVPWALPHLRAENGQAESHVRIGWFRSVCHIFHAFATCSFADELAAAAGRDPLEYLLELIGEPRHVDPTAEGAEYPNQGESLEDYPIDTGRLRRVTERAAREAGWGKELPRGRGLGIAAHRSFLTYVANVVEVEVTQEGELRIPVVHTAVDCGLAVHPDRVVAQFEGSAAFSASLALTGEVTAKDGAVEQGNFHQYEIARMDAAPKAVHVHLLDDGADLPGGAGEPGVPPFAPALCNAIYQATGERIRSLPLSRHDLSWG